MVKNVVRGGELDKNGARKGEVAGWCEDGNKFWGSIKRRIFLAS